MKSRTVLLILLLLFVARVIIAALTPVFETSEARYAAISANMARTGDFIVPRFTYNDRYQSFDGKPPLQFQLSGLGCKVFGIRPIAVRLPLLLISGLLIAFLGWTVVRLRPDCFAIRRGLLAAGLAGTSVAAFALAGFCMPDALLVPCVAAAYLCHALFLSSGNRNWTWGVASALGFGMLTKGPVALVLFGLPVFIDTCVNRRWQAIARYRWVSGLMLFLLVAAPWFVLMARENPGFLTYFFLNENLLRFVTHDYGDRYGAGREYFRGVGALWTLVVTLPWSPIFISRSWRRSQQIGFKAWLRMQFWSGDVACTFAWGVVGIAAFWSLTSRVPIGYVVPVIPLAAVWSALRIGGAAIDRLMRLLPWACLLAGAVIVGTLCVTRLTTHKLDGDKAVYRSNRYSYEFHHGAPHHLPREKR